MPRRRYISQNGVFDKRINKLSLEAEAVFYRMLSICDDFGIVPADVDELGARINLSGRRGDRLETWVNDIVNAGLGLIFEYSGSRYFIFKARAFDKYQSHVSGKRTQSEFLGLKATTREELCSYEEVRNFVDFLGKDSVTKVISTTEVVSSFERGLGKTFKEPKVKFQKPTQQEIYEYMASQRFAAASQESQKMWDYYEANGWRVGKNPMKNWQAAARNWMKNANKFRTNGYGKQPPTLEESIAGIDSITPSLLEIERADRERRNSV